MNAIRSGRTARMIEEAKKLSSEGKAVYIIAANEQQRRFLRQIVSDDIKVETPSSPGNFSWQDMRLRGAHRNCEILVDHFAIESHFGELINMYHRFDPPTPEAHQNATDDDL